MLRYQRLRLSALFLFVLIVLHIEQVLTHDDQDPVFLSAGTGPFDVDVMIATAGQWLYIVCMHPIPTCLHQ